MNKLRYSIGLMAVLRPGLAFGQEPYKTSGVPRGGVDRDHEYSAGETVLTNGVGFDGRDGPASVWMTRR